MENTVNSDDRVSGDVASNGHVSIGEPPKPAYCVCDHCKSINEIRCRFCCKQSICVSEAEEFVRLLNQCYRETASNKQARFRMYHVKLLHRFWDPACGKTAPYPDCVVSAIRKRFPDPNGQYTGYKTAEERNATKAVSLKKRRQAQAQAASKRQKK